MKGCKKKSTALVASANPLFTQPPKVVNPHQQRSQWSQCISFQICGLSLDIGMMFDWVPFGNQRWSTGPAHLRLQPIFLGTMTHQVFTMRRCVFVGASFWGCLKGKHGNRHIWGSFECHVLNRLGRLRFDWSSPCGRDWPQWTLAPGGSWVLVGQGKPKYINLSWDPIWPFSFLVIRL